MEHIHMRIIRVWKRRTLNSGRDRLDLLSPLIYLV